MSRTTLASLLTTAVVALSGIPASAQVVFWDPTTWMAPQPRPCYGPNCHAGYINRPMARPNYGPNYGGSYFQSGFGNRSNCPDGICGPVNRYPATGGCANGQCGLTSPRYPLPTAPLPYNTWRTPVPNDGYYGPGVSQTPRFNNLDRRVTPANYEDDAWSAPRSPRMGRSFESNGSPFYP